MSDNLDRIMQEVNQIAQEGIAFNPLKEIRSCSEKKEKTERNHEKCILKEFKNYIERLGCKVEERPEYWGFVVKGPSESFILKLDYCEILMDVKAAIRKVINKLEEGELK